MSKVRALREGSAQEVILDLMEMAPKIKQIIVVVYTTDDLMLFRRSSMLLKDQSYMVQFAHADTIQRMLASTIKK